MLFCGANRRGARLWFVIDRPLHRVRGDAADWRFSNQIVPKLREAGVTDEEIERLLIEDPRRFFEGEMPATLA